jgi:hypothetical protein
MNAETFAEWMRRQGHRVFRTTSSYWYEAGPRVLQAFPYHWLIRPSQEEIQSLTRQGILALRYSTPLDFPDGKASYHLFFYDPYDLDSMRRTARKAVSHGLTCFDVERISFERLAKDGWALQQSTLGRQGRSRSMSQAHWENLCLAGKDLPGFEAWGALSHGELAAALIICWVDDMANILFSTSHSKYLRDRVNNALVYTVSRNLLSRKGISGVFNTLQSLDAPTSIDDFKLGMGARPVAVRQRVDFHPLLQPFATTGIHKIVARLRQYDPGNPILAKAEGMLRFHVEGKQPLQRQSWPECLSSLLEYMLLAWGWTECICVIHNVIESFRL